MIADAVREMMARGVSAGDMAAIIEAFERDADPVDNRSTAARRQARYRERKRNESVTKRNESVTKRNESVTSVTFVTPRVTSLPKKEKSPHTPLKEKTPTLFPPDSPNGESPPDVVDWFEGQWNALAQACGLGRIRAMTDKRERAIRCRADDLVTALGFVDPLAGFTDTFNRIRGSPFLRGAAGGRPWKVDVDWVLIESNFLKIHEGKYAQEPQRAFGR